MSSEEEDYMSEDFLKACEASTSKSSLPRTRIEKRRLDQYKDQELQRAKQPKNKTALEHELREEGLEKPISSDNKGFKMLEKMGYKPGSSLGKSQEGIKEPIKINVKGNTSGVGRIEPVKKKQKIDTEEQQRAEKEYLANLRQQHMRKQLNQDIVKAQRACESLDFDQLVDRPVKSFYWTPQAMVRLYKEEQENAEDEEISEIDFDEFHNLDYEAAESKFFELLEYLRTTYFYCIYCMTLAPSYEALDDLCPGKFKEDHE